MNDLATRVQGFAEHTYGTWNRQNAWTAPMFIQDAEGVLMYYTKGKPYIDFSSQLMCSNLGHKNKAIIEAIVKQAEEKFGICPEETISFELRHATTGDLESSLSKT